MRDGSSIDWWSTSRAERSQRRAGSNDRRKEADSHVIMRGRPLGKALKATVNGACKALLRSHM